MGRVFGGERWRRGGVGLPFRCVVYGYFCRGNAPLFRWNSWIAKAERVDMP